VNGIHDLGGRHGFGRVQREADEPAFRAHWEGRVRAIASLLVARGVFSVDAFRHAIERLEPVVYLTDGYYGRWLGAVESLVRELGDELTAGRVPRADRAQRPVSEPPRFALGDRVRTRNLQPSGHTRLPGYAREKCGRVVQRHGGWVFPDTNAHDRGECPQHLYTVRFEGRELWGLAAEPGSCVHLDLFESYLESA
jgi:nitrile hydratase subunit beta